MNKTVSSDYRKAKSALDYIFIVNLEAIQQVHRIGALEIDLSQMHIGVLEIDLSQMHIGGAWSLLYMNISWLQRLYEKASLEDSGEISIEFPDEDDRVIDLLNVVSHLEDSLNTLENNNFSYLWANNTKVPKRIFNLMLDNIYTGTYEALSLLEREIESFSETQTNGDTNGSDK